MIVTLQPEVAAQRTALASLAPLFRYPDHNFHDRVREAAAASDCVLLFARAMERHELAMQQTIYTATFDLAPSCTPYLGIHLFGDENRDRARLMVGLRQSYVRAGLQVDRAELPDHIAEVLAFAPRAAEDEWNDLVRLVLVPALSKMNQILASTSNPYRYLMSAALRLSGGES